MRVTMIALHRSRRTYQLLEGVGAGSMAVSIGALGFVLSFGSPAEAATLDLFAAGDMVAAIGGTTQTIYHDEQSQHIDDFDLRPPDGTKVETLWRDPGRPFPPGSRAPLISAAAQDDGAYGAGVSLGLTFPGYNEADATLTYEYRNDGSAPVTYEHEFIIPIQSVGIAGYPTSYEDLQAYSRIQIVASKRDSDDIVTQSPVFAYSMELRKVANPSDWTTEFFLSNDMLSALDALGLEPEHATYYNSLPVDSSWVSTITVPSYVIETSSAINPGESLFLELYASAEVNIGPYGGEQGGEAFAGDPLNLMGSSGPTLFIDLFGEDVTPVPGPPAPVPLPASALLLIGGLSLLSGLRRCGARRAEKPDAVLPTTDRWLRSA